MTFVEGYVAAVLTSFPGPAWERGYCCTNHIYTQRSHSCDKMKKVVSFPIHQPAFCHLQYRRVRAVKNVFILALFLATYIPHSRLPPSFTSDEKTCGGLGVDASFGRVTGSGEQLGQGRKLGQGRELAFSPDSHLTLLLSLVVWKSRIRDWE